MEAFLPTAKVTLSANVLDRIDETVAPGVTVNVADNSYGDHEPRPEQRRRHSAHGPAERASTGHRTTTLGVRGNVRISRYSR